MAELGPIKSQLSELIKVAMKSGQKALLGYARNLHAAIRKKEIDDRVDLDDVGVRKIIQSVSKQRQESIDQFRKGGREDLVANEEAELKFLQGFMPAQMSDDELKKIVGQIVEKVGAKSPKDMGTVMKELLPQVEGRADGRRISEAVKAAISPSK